MLDIGGGLPVDYASDVTVGGRINPERYASALRSEVAPLFDETKYTLVTKFGRWLSAKSAIMVSRVEYTKVAASRRIAAVHCGADLFLRTCYQPSHWPHRVSAWSASGEFLEHGADDDALWDVVGPLCFRGDIVAAAVSLPSIVQSGCVIAVHDAGAYTLAMFSRYNSRQAPPVYAVTDAGACVEKMTAGESLDEALRMWQLCPAAAARHQAQPSPSNGSGRPMTNHSMMELDAFFGHGVQTRRSVPLGGRVASEQPLPAVDEPLDWQRQLTLIAAVARKRQL